MSSKITIILAQGVNKTPVELYQDATVLDLKILVRSIFWL